LGFYKLAHNSGVIMHTYLDIRCPNCGSLAHRHLFDEGAAICQSCPDQQVVQTECPVCDYLLVMCWKNGRVLEAYAPGIKVDVKPLPIAMSCSLAVRPSTAIALV
jgi:hypothetical protein